MLYYALKLKNREDMKENVCSGKNAWKYNFTKLWRRTTEDVPRGTNREKMAKMFHVEHIGEMMEKVNCETQKYVRQIIGDVPRGTSWKREVSFSLNRKAYVSIVKKRNRKNCLRNRETLLWPRTGIEVNRKCMALELLYSMPPTALVKLFS